ncbi:MAG: hypothetical protein ISS80_02950, partial [Candidatus Cloacimonetes bacterium]|nr:hypothetical protein [Candidatus Cloacimonadota bacterium]
MKKKLLSLALCLLSMILLAQTENIYLNQTIPEFSTQELYVKGSDFLNWYKQGDESHLNLNLEGNYNYFSQKKDRNF